MYNNCTLVLLCLLKCSNEYSCNIFFSLSVCPKFLQDTDLYTLRIKKSPTGQLYNNYGITSTRVLLFNTICEQNVEKSLYSVYLYQKNKISREYLFLFMPVSIFWSYFSGKSTCPTSYYLFLRYWPLNLKFPNRRAIESWKTRHMAIIVSSAPLQYPVPLYSVQCPFIVPSAPL